jgi:hypothetical protein
MKTQIKLYKTIKELLTDKYIITLKPLICRDTYSFAYEYSARKITHVYYPLEISVYPGVIVSYRIVGDPDTTPSLSRIYLNDLVKGITSQHIKIADGINEYEDKTV